ncbi:conserved hypothetical protein [Gammaproteobacteria bacterium]
MAITSAFYTTPASSTTQNIPRSVEDKVRDMFPESAKLMALVAVGSVNAGRWAEQAGRISKKSVDQMRFECYSYTPLAVELSVTVAVGAAQYTVADATNIVAPYCVFNPRNGTTARVDSISTSDLLTTSFGTTTFSAVAGDTLIVMAPCYGEASQDPIALYKNEDNLYNTTGIHRFPVKISGSARATVSYFGDYFKRMKEVDFKNGKRKTERTLLFSNRASGSANTTSGGSVYSTAFGTTRGLWNWAAGALPFGGVFTPEKFRDIPSYYADNTANIVGDQSPMIMFCGNKTSGVMQNWVNLISRTDKPGGEVDVFGLKCKQFMTSTFSVNVMVHDAFNATGLKNKALLFNPEELFYAFLKGRDLKPNNNIQVPSLDGYMDEIMGEIGLGVRCGGQSVLQLTDLW